MESGKPRALDISPVHVQPVQGTSRENTRSKIRPPEMLSSCTQCRMSLEHVTEDLQRLRLRQGALQSAPFQSLATPDLKTKKLFELNAEGYNQLHSAAACGELENLISLIRFSGHDRRLLNLRDVGGNTALHWALSEGHTKAAGLLVLGGASVLVVDAEGVSALQQAVAQGDVNVLQMLMQAARRAGASPISDSAAATAIGLYIHEGVTGFHLAVSSGNTQMLHFLKELGVDINARDAKSGRTALHFCVEAGNEPLVEALLTSIGVDPNVRTYSLHSALDLAEGRGLHKICELLKKHNAVHGCSQGSGSEVP